MTIPVFTCLVLGFLLVAGGGGIIFQGRRWFRNAGSCTRQDIRALGTAHVLVGLWFLLGGIVEEPNTTLGACLLMTKVRYCMADY